MYHYLDLQCHCLLFYLRCSLLIIFQIVTTNNWHDVMNSVRSIRIAYVVANSICRDKLNFIYLNVCDVNVYRH